MKLIPPKTVAAQNSQLHYVTALSNPHPATIITAVHSQLGVCVIYPLSDTAVQSGFIAEPIGTHASRTIMLAELRLLLAACPPDATPEDYRGAVFDDNVLLKKTDSTRHSTFRFLRELYLLDPKAILFRALRDLWSEDIEAQPLLAMLCAQVRDPILRATSHFVLQIPEGAAVTPEMLSDAVKSKLPNRYSPIILAKIGRNAASSWQQSGHLQGRAKKVRAQAQSKPTSVSYALLLGYLCDARGEALFHTLWAQLLDTPVATLHERAFAASQRGWLDYRKAGQVTDIGFSYLLRK